MKICFLSGIKEIVGREELVLPYEGRLSGLLEHLYGLYGEELRVRLLDADMPGGRSPFAKILVNGEDARDTDPTLKGDEEVFLFLPIAGG